MKEENKLIAEFMGFKLQDNPNERFYNQYFTESNGTWGNRIEIMHFDSSWDWLIPVVEKIDEICGIDLHEWDEYINNSLCSKSLNTTYYACIEFIKWYNQKN